MASCALLSAAAIAESAARAAGTIPQHSKTARTLAGTRHTYLCYPIEDTTLNESKLYQPADGGQSVKMSH
jgi:hypothetical protein